jgi:hypothetical protein
MLARFSKSCRACVRKCTICSGRRVKGSASAFSVSVWQNCNQPPTLWDSQRFGYHAVMAEMALNRQAQAQRGKRLEYFTIARNSLEGLVGVVTGAIAGSISLVGFGIDSLIEVTSGSTLLWRMSDDADEPRRERNEKLSLRIVGICFFC